jgi:hypothetical protein
MTIPSETAITATFTLLSLAGCWIVLAWFYRSYRVDLFRHRLFVLRAELFDRARRGEIAFDHPAYVNLRITLNGFLRFADRIGFVSMLLTSHTLRRCPPGSIAWTWERDWSEAVGSLSPDLQKHFLDLRSRLHFEVFKQLLFGSPLLMLTLIPPVLVAFLRIASDSLLSPLLRGAYRAIERAFKEIADPLDGFAYKIGEAV